MADTLASLKIMLGLDASGVQRGAKQAQGFLGGLQGQATLAAGAAGFAMGDFVAGGIQDFARFDQKMREVFTLMPGLSADVRDQMSGDVRDFAKQFGIATDEAVAGLYNSLSAGIEREDVFDFMETAQQAATAGVTDLTSSIGLLTAVTKGYGDTSVEFTRKASDLAFTTVKLGQTTFGELASSIGENVPLAETLGIRVEELNAVYATLTGVTGNASKVTTQFKAVQNALIAQNPAMTKALKSQGFETSKAALESLGLQGTLEMLVESAGGSEQKLREMFGSTEALTALLPLTSAQAGKFTSNLEEMETASGATVEAFEEMDSGIAATGRKIKAWFADLALTAGQGLQALGPVMVAFGPNLGRWMGRGFGAAFGVVAAQVPRLMAPVIAKMTATMAAANFAPGITQSLSGGFNKAGVRGMLRGIGGRWGLLLGAGAAAAMAPIIIAGLMELKDSWAEVGEQIDRTEFNTENIQAGAFSLQEMRDALPGIEKGIDEIKRKTRIGGEGGIVLFAEATGLKALEQLRPAICVA
jgi:TP901 family phage tail tape measure protein